MTQVKFNLAYSWICACGEINFCHPVVAEFSQEEADEMRASGMQPTPGGWVTFPDEVECGKCHQLFEAETGPEDDDEDDDDREPL
jgi:hypothetical protein